MILIDMEKPLSCEECRFCEYEQGYCTALPVDEWRQITDMSACPLSERKTGKWVDENGKQVYVDKDGFVTDDSCTCSECGAWLVASDEYLCRGRYCPNCGAKMEVDE